MRMYLKQRYLQSNSLPIKLYSPCLKLKIKGPMFVLGGLKLVQFPKLDYNLTLPKLTFITKG